MNLQLAVLASFVMVASAAYYLGNALTRHRTLTADRLAVYGRKTGVAEGMRDKELKRPFGDRALAPVLDGMGRMTARFTPIGWITRTNQRLEAAGNPWKMDANGWAVVRVLAVLVSLGLFLLMRDRLPANRSLLVMLGLLAAGWLGPDSVLNRKRDERNSLMRRSLPDILDLLVISVEAGLGFDSSLNRVVQTVPGPLSEEFRRMLMEIRVGVSRREAMRKLRDRTSLEELRQFLLAMMQADTYGVPIARVLRVQADEMRIKRRQHAQEKAFAVPVKMTFPLVLLVGSFLIILLGPAAMKFRDTIFAG